MNESTLIAKLNQIEEQAGLTLDEFPKRLSKERQRMIIALAKFVRSELQDSEAGDDSFTSPPPRDEKAKVLVADALEMEQDLRACFSEHALTYVSSLDAAERVLSEERYDAVVIGMTFNDSHMFTLLRHVRSHQQCRYTPVMCIRGNPEPLARETHKGFEDAVRAAGGDAFIDFEIGEQGLTGLCEVLAGILSRGLQTTKTARRRSRRSSDRSDPNLAGKGSPS